MAFSFEGSGEKIDQDKNSDEINNEQMLNVEMKNVEGEAAQKDNEVGQQTTEKTSENPEPELEKQKQENIEKFEKEMSSLLDQALSNMPQQMSEYFNSSEYKKLIELSDKKRQEERELFKAYDKITKGGNGSHRRVNFFIGDGGTSQYIDDLKHFNAPKDTIKRFEDFNDKFVKTIYEADMGAGEIYAETLGKDRWPFFDALQQKTYETFKDDPDARKETYEKWADTYNSNYDQIKEKLFPNARTEVSTRGMIFGLKN